ncbi:hypothetical protein [Saccharolobus caldissimus]|uniref:Uncharacterized protein n=1 Tax=Saccharolobus caldissimus TaxID=1702097 RepID=A0AAQ4CNW4_9CREN|nr:hypothetical protein [Saccharolobus caldissimus]BDB97495.1 hypothetical protein SACC_05120 [Saccharolobus caldissimus]
MKEKIVDMDTNTAFNELKRILFANGCKIISEDPPRSITVRHGTLWATSPKNFPKTVRFYLYPQGTKTRIVAVTSYSESYISMSIIIIILVIIFIAIVNSSLALLPEFNRRIVEALLTLLYIIIVFAAITGVYNYVKKDSFAEEILRILP